MPEIKAFGDVLFEAVVRRVVPVDTVLAALSTMLEREGSLQIFRRMTNLAAPKREEHR